LIVLIVALLIFGSRLPKMMRGLGSSVKEFRHGMEESTDDQKKVDSDDAEPK
jgi:TatA/E family protein of Tat protein translocase